MRSFVRRLALLVVATAPLACSASGTDVPASTGPDTGGGGTGGQSSGAGGSATGGNSHCGKCDLANHYTSCDSGTPMDVACPQGCTDGKGCTDCRGGQSTCVGNDVHACNADGTVGDLVSSCPTGQVCDAGACKSLCDVSAEQPSNVGCEFYAADLDIADILQVAHQPWGLVIANAGETPADVVIERNDAPVGMPPHPVLVNQGTLMPGQLGVQLPPIDILDCGTMPDQHDAPGTCLSSNALHVTSTAPIVVYQFNNFTHDYSTDASLLLPTTAIGTQYRVIGWPSGHPVALPGAFVERTYVTVIGTQPNTMVTVSPKWRIKGNAPIAATPAGGMVTATIGPFDVLNLESDDAMLSECTSQTAPFCTDLSGSTIEASAPIVVFSGTESSGVGLPEGAPVPPTCVQDPMNPDPSTSCGCCLQHFEEQLAPVTALGKKYVVTRSPIRSDPSSGYVEPDVLRFVGAAEPAQVTTTLPAPFDSFTLQPGEIKDTWTDHDIVVTASAPILIGQFLVAGDYVQPNPSGDPSFTVFQPVEQAQSAYVFLSPDGWNAWVVISAPNDVDVQVDGAEPSGCVVAPAGTLDGTDYEARRCKLATGVHRLTGSGPFGIMAYGFSDADAYAFPGGAFFKKIYTPPPLH